MPKRPRVPSPARRSPASRTNETLSAALEPLTHSGLLQQSPDAETTFQFKHALVQDSAYETLLKQDRQQLHLEAARAMERLYPGQLDENAARLAEHYSIAGSEPETLAYAIRAGDFAWRLHASAEARLHYSRALEMLEQQPSDTASQTLHLDLLLKLVGVSMYVEDPALNLERLAQAENIGLQLPGPGGDRLRLAHIGLARGLIYFWQNEPRAAIESFVQVLPVAQEYNNEELLTRPSSAIGSVLTLQGHFSQAAPLLAQALPLLARSGDWSNWVVGTGFLGLGLAARGQYKAGLAKGHEGLAAARASNDPTALAQGYNLTALIYMQGGDYVHMLEDTIACKETAENSGDRMYQYIGYAVEAWADSRLGRHDEAYANLDKANALVGHLGTQILGSDWRAAGIAEMACAAGNYTQALHLAQEAVTLAQMVGGIFAEGLARRVWGQALSALEPPQWDTALSHFAASLQLLNASEAVLEAARTRVAWGKALAARGERDAARAQFQAAAAQFEQSELTRELEETRLLLQSAA